MPTHGLSDPPPRWPHEQQVGPWQFHADFALDTLRPLLNEMARLERDLTTTLELRPPAETSHVFLFSRESSYQGYLERYFPQVPRRRALFIKGRQGPGMVYAHRHPQVPDDLRHEGTHALLHAALPVVPLWLDEGLAEYFEPPPAERSRNAAHLQPLKWRARWGQVPRLEQLERVRDMTDLRRSEYRNAWAWVHFMLHGPAVAREELVAYLADLQSLTPPGRLSERLSRRVPDLQHQFADHLRRWKA